jgi:hypothetical protein
LREDQKNVQRCADSSHDTGEGPAGCAVLVRVAGL